MKHKIVDVAVNLLPEDPFFGSLAGRTMRWAVSVGRYLVIFTELIVILSFLARFSLDRQLTDLNEQITQKESIVKSFGDLETRITTVQDKINQYQQLGQSKDLTQEFAALSAITPQGIALRSLAITPNRVSITGIAQSQNALNLLINNIQLSPNYFNVRVERIESQEDEQNTGLLFQIQADTEVVPVTASGAAPAAGGTTPPVTDPALEGTP